MTREKKLRPSVTYIQVNHSIHVQCTCILINALHEQCFLSYKEINSIHVTEYLVHDHKENGTNPTQSKKEYIHTHAQRDSLIHVHNL